MNSLKKITYLTLSVLFFSCSKKEEKIHITPNDYHSLVDKVTKVMIHDIFSPPVASRVYVYPNIAAYEVLNQENIKYKSLTNQLNGFKNIPVKTLKKVVNKRLSALIAFLEVAKELVFSKEKIITFKDSLYTSWKLKNSSEFTKAFKYASPIISSVKKWMFIDNYANTRILPEYNISSKNPSKWKPTPPAYMKGIEPNWNKIRTFVLTSSDEFKPIPPPKFSMQKNSDFYKELYYVYELTNSIKSKGNLSKELAIAQFWDCNPYVAVNRGHFMFAKKKITPGAHWIGICKLAAKKSAADFEKTVFAYTKTSIAIFDAFISCWDEKYRSKLVRPETLINNFIDDSWTPILQTPPFPEYTSGHSVVSGAASEVLTSIFGDDFDFNDTTEIPFGLPARKFYSFRGAAKEAAISRIYGGIHYNAAIKTGLDQGILIGKKINEKIIFLH